MYKGYEIVIFLEMKCDMMIMVRIGYAHVYSVFILMSVLFDSKLKSRSKKRKKKRQTEKTNHEEQ